LEPCSTLTVTATTETATTETATTETATLSSETAIPAPAVYGDPQRTGLTSADLLDGVTEHLFFTVGRTKDSATPHDLYLALSHAVRDRLMSRHLASKDEFRQQQAKSVAYLSAEFLIGPQLGNNLLMLGLRQEAEAVMRAFGITDLQQLLDIEEEPGLGNGGLGRLAACFLDSLASLEMPATGYGIRYEFGIFDQEIRQGWQVEISDQWLKGGWPWELVYPDKYCLVRFGGHTQSYRDGEGNYRVRWVGAETVMGIPHDVPILGYRVNTCARLRLWRAVACQSFDVQTFNRGDFEGAVAASISSETISKVLYPNDETLAGRRLRLKQQLFFVSCSLQDMLRIQRRRGLDLRTFADHWAVQLNDTHPAIAVAELMRLLIDEERLEWDQAWQICGQAIAYTNHTLLPEALECWDLQMFGELLPRHLEIIYEINDRFLRQVRLAYPGDEQRLGRMSIIDERGRRSVRMAHLAVIAAHQVNGVAALHSRLVQQTLLPDFDQLWPNKITNVTNGVTPRRWVALANPALDRLLQEAIGMDWPVRPERWPELEQQADNSGFLERWAACKQDAKRRLAQRIASDCHVSVDPMSLFDVQVKRIHEYKRQHLNALQIIARYLRLRGGESLPPRTFIFAGKAAPGYHMAKLIIRLLHGIAAVVNTDPISKGQLQVAFLPDYNVKLSELIIPAADLSEQISTAGYEASGTGNMKLSMNGALTIGTLDGANVEIREKVGAANFFLFGLTAEQIGELLIDYRPWEVLSQLPLLQEVLAWIEQGNFSDGDRDLFRPLTDKLRHHDPYALIADFAAYQDGQAAVDQAWQDQRNWQRQSLQTVARSGYFSSDRAIRDYAERIWNVKSMPVEMSCSLSPVPIAVG
jgi:starch phosphorylase